MKRGHVYENQNGVDIIHNFKRNNNKMKKVQYMK